MALSTKPLDEVRADVPLQQEDMVRVNILVPASMRKAWKAAGVSRGETVTDMVIAAMAQYIERRST